MSISYLDFELEIGAGDGRTYPVAVLQSPAGNLRSRFDFSLGALELENRLLSLQNALLRSGGDRRKMPTRDERIVRTFGLELFTTLFQDDVRSLFYESKRMAAAQGSYLRVKLRILDPQMAALPWEFLFDARQNEYLSLAHSTPLIRYLEVAQPPQPLRIEPPLRILGMIASPTDLEPLKVDVEKERLEQALAGLIDDGLVHLDWLQGQTWRELHRAMRPNQGPWHVFHFVGHGGFDAQRDEGLLAFANRAGISDLRTATEVARLLSGQPSLRLALLNACEGAYASTTDIFASTAATLVQQGIPAVIAMQYEITDRAAIEFSEQFYDALTAGLPVDSSVTDARRAVSLAINNTLEWGIPVLFMRAPDGVIFEFGEEGIREEGIRDTGLGIRDTGVRIRDEGLGIRGERDKVGENVAPAEKSPVGDETSVDTFSGEQVQEIWQALLDGYSASTLPQFVRFQLNERLDEIAGGENFQDRVYNLVDWAERTGRLAELLAKAQANNSGNKHLYQAAKEILGQAEEPVAVEPPTEEPAAQKPKESQRRSTKQSATVRAAERAPEPEIMKPSLPSSPINFEWCHVPAGEFVMGAEDYDDEKPIHHVVLPEFYMAKYPITNAQYKQFVDAENHRTPRHWKNSKIPANKDDHPVVWVSWHDAMAFCQWAGVQLPSEAQWEKAARGTDGRVYPWGNELPTAELCNFWDSRIGDTTPIGDYPKGASPFGCLDMAGNVWEWTSSLYKPYPYVPDDGRENQKDGGRRTWRGGSFVSDDLNVGCAYRNFNNPDNSYNNAGFRVMSPGAVGR